MTTAMHCQEHPRKCRIRLLRMQASVFPRRSNTLAKERTYLTALQSKVESLRTAALVNPLVGPSAFNACAVIDVCDQWLEQIADMRDCAKRLRNLRLLEEHDSKMVARDVGNMPRCLADSKTSVGNMASKRKLLQTRKQIKREKDKFHFARKQLACKLFLRYNNFLESCYIS